MKRISLLVLLVVLLLPSMKYFAAKSLSVLADYHNSPSLVLNSLGNADYERLLSKDSGVYSLLRHIRYETDRDARFLIFRPSDFTRYADRQYIVMDDPRLLPLYSAGTKQVCYDILTRMGIDYVYFTPVMGPFIYRTMLYAVLSDFTMADLVYDGGGYRLFKIASADGIPSQSIRESGERAIRSIPVTGWMSMGGGTLDRPLMLAPDEPGGVRIGSDDQDGLAALYSGSGYVELAPSHGFADAPIMPRSRYLLRAQVAGSGVVQAYVFFYDRNGDFAGSTLLWDSVFYRAETGFRAVSMQFMTPLDAREFRMVFVVRGAGWLELASCDLAAPRGASGQYSVAQVGKESDSIQTNIRTLTQSPLTSLLGTARGYRMGADDLGVSEDFLRVSAVDFGAVLFTGHNFTRLSSSSLDRYRVRAELSGKGAFELQLQYYEDGRVVARSLGYYRIPSYRDRVSLVRVVDLPDIATGFRVVFDPVRFAVGSYHYVRDENYGEVRVHSLAIDKNRSVQMGFSKPAAPDWKQVYPD